MGFTGSCSERKSFLILTGSFKVNTSVTFIGATGMIIGGCYSLWLFNRIAYGNLKTQYFKKYLDLNKREFLMFVPLILGTIVMGLYPEIFLNSIHFSVNLLVELMYF